MSRAQNHMRTVPAALMVLFFWAAQLPAAEPDFAAVAKETSGLVVHVGCGDAAVTVSLCDRNRAMVQGLCRDDVELAAAGKRILDAGAAGWVSVRRVDDFKLLPYASHLADLVVADLDALGPAAPTQEELLRITAPGGMVYARKGTWQKTIKPMPAGVDEWTHEAYGPEGNPCSQDQVVAPSFAMQWIGGYQGTEQGMDSQVLRVAGGRAIFFRATPLGPRRKAYYLEGRSAWNGVVRWRRPMTVPGDSYTPLIATADRVYTVIDGPLVALDAATGQTVATFREAGNYVPARAARSMEAVLTGDLLIVAHKDKAYGFDARTAALRWTWTSHGLGNLYFPRMTAAGGSVYVLAAGDTAGNGVGDHGWRGVIKSAAVVALDAGTGKELWRQTHVGNGDVASLVLHPKHGLFVQGFGFKPFRENNRLVRLNLSDGKVLWDWQDEDRKRGKGVTGMRTLAFSDTTGFMLTGGDFIRRFDPARPVVTRTDTSPGDNYCFGGSITANLVFDGHHWYDSSKAGPDNFIFATHAMVRCTQRPYLGAGMMYIVEGMQCQCYAHPRGVRALSSEAAGPATTDLLRRRTGPGLGLKHAALDSPPVAFDPPYLYEVDPTMKSRAVQVLDLKPRPLEAKGPLLASDWVSTDAFAPEGKLSVKAADLTVSVDIHRHTLVATRSGKQVWTFLAGGRISSPPVIHRGLCLFGSHDGQVYALDAATGALAWTYLAAWNHRQMMAYGQLESVWPVYGVAVHEGRAYASAGRHPELDHGLFVVGLDAATGAAVWTTRLALDPTWGKSLEGGARGPFYLMNAPPSLAAGNKLKIAGAPRLDLATGILSDPHKVYTSAPVPRQPSGYRPAER